MSTCKLVILLLIATFTSSSSNAIQIQQGSAEKEKQECIQGQTMSDRMYTMPVKVPTKIRISFVGDSVTEGVGLNEQTDVLGSHAHTLPTNGQKNQWRGYPYYFWKILEDKGIADQFEVLNFAHWGRLSFLPEDMPKTGEKFFRDYGDHSIFDSCDYPNMLKSQSNAVVVMMGTNDVGFEPDIHDPWVAYHETFKRGYLKLTKALAAMDSKPAIYLIIPPPMNPTPRHENSQRSFLSQLVMPNMIREVAKEIPIPDDHVINVQDLITSERRYELLMPDQSHPNPAGCQIIAQKIYDTVIADEDHYKLLRDKLYKIGQD